jgi:hypothetical protein
MCLISAELVLKAVKGIGAPGALPEPDPAAPDPAPSSDSAGRST